MVFCWENLWKVITAEQIPAKWVSLVKKTLYSHFHQSQISLRLTQTPPPRPAPPIGVVNKLIEVMTILQKGMGFFNFFWFHCNLGFICWFSAALKGTDEHPAGRGESANNHKSMGATPREHSDPDGSALWDVFLCSVKWSHVNTKLRLCMRAIKSLQFDPHGTGRMCWTHQGVQSNIYRGHFWIFKHQPDATNVNAFGTEREPSSVLHCHRQLSYFSSSRSQIKVKEWTSCFEF